MARQIQLFEDREALYGALPQCCVGAELGVRRGRNARALLEFARPKRLHLIDIWNNNKYFDVCIERVGGDPRVEIHKMRTMVALDRFDDEYFDWIYIDADHGYSSVLEELRGYHSKVKRNGWVFGHDFLNRPNKRAGIRHPLGIVKAVIECIQDGLYECYYLTGGDSPSYGLRKLN